jgi:hypothetical protein
MKEFLRPQELIYSKYPFSLEGVSLTTTRRSMPLSLQSLPETRKPKSITLSTTGKEATVRAIRSKR